MANIKQSYKERVIEQFDQKFFIAGKNAYGEEKPLLFPAKTEVRDFISRALDNQMKEVIECLPGTVVLDQSFYENQDSKEFIEWAAYCKYKEDLLTNLKSRGLI